MIERTIPATPRIRAGIQPQATPEAPRPWMQDRAPSLRALTRDRQRREQVWAWLSLVVLVICWDVSSRLEERVSLPRTRIAHALEDKDTLQPAASLTVDL